MLNKGKNKESNLKEDLPGSQALISSINPDPSTVDNGPTSFIRNSFRAESMAFALATGSGPWFSLILFPNIEDIVLTGLVSESFFRLIP